MVFPKVTMRLGMLQWSKPGEMNNDRVRLQLDVKRVARRMCQMGDEEMR